MIEAPRRLFLGGELHNSSASSAASLRQAFAAYSGSGRGHGARASVVGDDRAPRGRLRPLAGRRLRLETAEAKGWMGPAVVRRLEERRFDVRSRLGEAGWRAFSARAIGGRGRCTTSRRWVSRSPRPTPPRSHGSSRASGSPAEHTWCRSCRWRTNPGCSVLVATERGGLGTMGSRTCRSGDRRGARQRRPAAFGVGVRRRAHTAGTWSEVFGARGGRGVHGVGVRHPHRARRCARPR